MARLFLFLAASSAVLVAQGTKPRTSPTAYPAHADLKGITVAAENLGHSITSDYGAYVAREFLVIEVAVFSVDKKPLSFSAGNFSLRVNGSKVPLLPQTPGLVADTIKYEDWSQGTRVTGSAGDGDTGVIVGGPRPTERFPGDPNGNPRIPKPPSVDTNDPNVPQRQDLPVGEAVQRSSLPEGTKLVAPFSGFVFFPFKGKLKKVKSLELLYHGDYGETALPLP
jgi:hypothetical protein